MPGPAQPWDLPEDPRDQTVDLPRIDLATFSNGKGNANGNGNGRALPRPGTNPYGEPLNGSNGHSAQRAADDQRRSLPPGQGPRPEVLPSPSEPASWQPPDRSRDPYASPPGTTARIDYFAASNPPADQPAAAKSPGLSELGQPPAPGEIAKPKLPDGSSQADMPSRPEEAPARSQQPSPPVEAPAASGATPPVEPPPAAPVRPQPDPQPDPLDDMPAWRPGGERTARGAVSAPAPAAQATRRTSRPPERSGPGSLTELRARLERLPDGHPSSPYEDGGLAKPLPHRLRQLELGLPAPEREAVEPAVIATSARPPALIDAEPETPAAEPEKADPLPAADSATPADPGREPHPHGPENPDDEPAQRAPRPTSDQDPYTLPAVTNGHRARRAGPDCSEQSTARQVTREPSADLSSVVATFLAKCRASAGEAGGDGYRGGGLTATMRDIATQLKHGGFAPGSAENILKSPEKVTAKLVKLIARHPGRTAEELTASITDGLRYAFTFPPEYYAEGTWLVHQKLKVEGYELEARRNRWESPEYKGVWTRWRDFEHGADFEVQFHTNASWDVVQRTHRAYLEITEPRTRPGDRARLRSAQVAAAASAAAPPHWTEISDFGRRAR